jgi:lipopolysaccharide/colanic/teichoic acid biosynthesis glycosyltransferase
VNDPDGLYAVRAKRVADLAGSVLALAILSPVFLALAAAIRLETPGPVLYRQERVGFRGRSFELLKFRSMVVGAETMGAGVLVEKVDPRVTRVGRLIRRLSVDELPQIVNVLRGEMSFIGPRPALPYQVAQYDERQRGRLAVRPGITGWAQVNGRNSIPWDERIRLDLEYVSRVSPAMDLAILARTIPVVFQGGGRIARREYWKRP